MAELFSEAWMQGFMDQWNAESDLCDALAQIGFNSVIGYGFEGDSEPSGVLVVEKGKAVSAGPYENQELNWDIRCSRKHWEKWIASPPGMMGLGTAFATGKMKFAVGDYGAILDSGT
jgi:putative sterol carrier protein